MKRKKIQGKLVSVTQLIFLYFFLSFSFTLAEVSFSEIQFDPEGSDSGQEWVEVYNGSQGQIHFVDYKFCEGGVCHGLSSEEDGMIDSFQYGIITTSPEKFQENFPDSQAVVFKSSFSLKNSEGETLELQNEDKNLVSVLMYNPEIGGKNGDTLSVIESTLENSYPTPGSENKKKEVILKEEETESALAAEESAEGDSESSFAEDRESVPEVTRTYVQIEDPESDLLDGEKKVRVDIIPFERIIAGSSTVFEAKVLELSGADMKKPEQISYTWNFGDGSISHEKSPTHVYKNAGSYIISLKVLVNGWSGKTKIAVDVLDTPISIQSVDYDKKNINISNNSPYIIHLGGFVIVSQNNFFVIPEDTYIQSYGEIQFPSETTQIFFKEDQYIALAYNNGKTLSLWEPQRENEKAHSQKNTDNGSEENSVEKEEIDEDIEDSVDGKNDQRSEDDENVSFVWNAEDDSVYQSLLEQNKKFAAEIAALKNKNKESSAAQKTEVVSNISVEKTYMEGGPEEVQEKVYNLQEEKSIETNTAIENKSKEKWKDFAFSHMYTFIWGFVVLLVLGIVYMMQYKKEEGLKNEEEDNEDEDIDEWDIKKF